MGEEEKGGGEPDSSRIAWEPDGEVAVAETRRKNICPSQKLVLLVLLLLPLPSFSSPLDVREFTM